ncbi:hypothetical protein KKD57_00090, partial [Patescibacteria group bacterium]|nr:hypothetical protein [Patescibacteria group bacterium]
NTNFFSKDTIYAYSEPNDNVVEGKEILQNADVVEYVYGLDEYNKKFKLASLQRIKNDINLNEVKIYTLKDLERDIEYSIHSDYWSRLAPRAVLTGAGIIKLFKDEANKAAGNPQSIMRPKSVASVYGSLAPTIRTTDPLARTIATVGQLLANAAIYTSGKILTAGQNIIISAYDSAKSSAIAFYDWGKAAAVAAYNAAKSTVVAAYDAVKTTTITVFNKTKTGLQLAQEYVFTFANSAIANIGVFFNSSADSIFSYLTPTTKAQLEFDISKPLPAVYLLEDIISQAKAAENAEAVIAAAPIYDAELSAVKNQKSVFASSEEIALSAKIKNIGAAIWQGDKISLNVYTGENLAKQFYHSSWLTKVRPASLGKIKIAPGAAGTFGFVVTAPRAQGDYFFRVRPVWQSDKNEFNWLGLDGNFA